MKCPKHRLIDLTDNQCPVCQEEHEALVRVAMDRLRNRMLPLSVSPGELFDRYTILLLKAYRVADTAKAVRAQKEALAIRSFIYGQSAVFALPDLDPLIGSLEDCNQRLWDIEDRIRALDAEVHRWLQYNVLQPLDQQRPTVPKNVIEYLQLARAVYTTNDERASCKAAIDEACGHKPEVKQYQEYSHGEG